MKKRFFLCCLLIIFIYNGLSSQVKLGGGFENTSFAYVENEVFNFDNASQLKLNLNYRSSDTWRLYSDVRLTTYYGFAGLTEETVLYVDKAGNYALDLDIARLYLKANFDTLSFTLGKDYLSFGSPSLFNTLEWYKNFSLLDPSQTKPAINLISISVPIGSYGKLKSFIGGNETWDDVLSGSEIVLGTSGFEGGLAYQYKGNNTNVVGAFFKLDALVTVTGSYSFHINNVFIEEKKFSTSYEANIAFDYSFPIGYSNLVLNQSFYYNSLGAKNLEDVNSTRYGDYYFKAMWYSYTSLLFSFDEFLSFSIDGLVSLVDTSFVIIPGLNYSLADGLLLDVGAGFYFGEEKTEFSPLETGIPNASILVAIKASF